jgi:predicted outer membrane repeat protein
MGNNFKYLDELVHSGVKKIILDSDIVLGEGEESEYSDGIKLDFDDLIIDGNNYSIDACEKTRIFECSGKNVSIKNITLKNGYSKEHGGAILNTSDLSIFNSKFMKNRTKHDGAAIYNCKGDLTIMKATFDNNAASYYNPNSRGKGGAIDNVKGILNIEESLFAGNYSSYGGAIRNGGELTIDHSTFDKNTAGMDGGAVYNEPGAILNIIVSTFTQNKADFNGGALYNDGKSALNIAGSTFIKNIVFWEGGAIYNRDGNLTIGESRLMANEARQSTT